MIRAVTVCVEFDDLLRITLPHTLQHVDEVFVITSPSDDATQELCKLDGRVHLHITDAFYRRGAEFNKGLAIEEGFDVLGRSGRILILDSDIVIPPEADLESPPAGKLYGARRRQCANPAVWNECDWAEYPLIPDHEIAGYFQLFDADHPCLNKRPWYPTNYRSAASCDSEFFFKFGGDCELLSFEVLHLGMMSNWTGRRSPRVNGTMPERRDERQESLDRIVAGRMNGRRKEVEILQ